MIDTPEAVADLKATVDYIGGITEQSDMFDFETATDIRDEMERVKAAAVAAIQMLEGQMLVHLEAGSRERGNRVWARARKYVDRHDHDVLVATIEQRAISDATDLNTGEVMARKAVEIATRRMRDLFLSPSDKAKTTVAEKLGLARDDYESREYKGYRLSITELDPG